MKKAGRIATVALAIIVGWLRPPILASQSTDRPSKAASEEMGLLVGLSSQRTLWISSTDGAFRLVADKPYLLVPRTDGFWWVGTINRCFAEELNGEGMNITEVGGFVVSGEELFVTRAADTAHVVLNGEDCATAEQKAHEINKRIARAMADSLAAAGDSTALHSLAKDTATVQDSEETYCEIGTRTITFVSPKMISIEKRDRVTEFCTPAKYYESGENRVMPFGDTTNFDLAQVLTQRQRQRVSRDLAEWLNGRELEADSNPMNGLGWAVTRDRGNWVASVFIDGPIVARGGSDMEYRPTLPHSFTGAVQLPISWAKLKKLVPDLRDAASSPSGSHVVLIAGDTLMVAPVNAGVLGKPLIKLGVGPYQDFVMLRWASRSEMLEWNRAIPALPGPYIEVRSQP
jgi:hypothetical protein